jgi:hypothetical protein
MNLHFKGEGVELWDAEFYFGCSEFRFRSSSSLHFFTTNADYNGNAMTERQQTKNPVEARQGETSGHMRIVLGASTLLAIVALGSVYMWFMHMH